MAVKRLEFAPVFPIHIFICIPLPGEEREAPADDLTIEECGKGREPWCKMEG